MRRTAAIVIGLLLVVVCGLAAVGAGLAYFYYGTAVEARPVVLIGSPGEGDRVQVGEAVIVQATARDEAGVVRVELWVDGELLEAQSSSLPEGTSPFPLVTRWEPSSPGAHILAVRAFNPEDGRGYASISVEAAEVPDRDGDGVADEDDSCPDEPGLGASAGCADGDGDGVVDSDDACPDEVGIAEADGCPAATEGDRDGDGVVDADDACPDELGLPQHDGCPRPADFDGDGVDDELDVCPGEPGLSQLNGCPDLDGDGVSDEDDDCPAEPGLPEQGGCPDRDGDGVRDSEDLRPHQPGRPEDFGAPDTGAPDSDGDGVPDDLDRCDDEQGLPEYDGCRAPGQGADLNDDGIADEDQASEGNLFGTLSGVLLGIFVESGLGPVEPDLAVVEVEGLEFLLGQQYDEVACYIGVGDYLERYGPYELEGGTRWDIATDLGGDNSVVVQTPADEVLEVSMECEAYVGDEPPLHLGVLRQEHDREEWDGRRLIGRSEREEEPFGATFVVQYHICEDSCEEASLPPPSARQVPTSVRDRYIDRELVWEWEGDEETIDEFRIQYGCDWGQGAVLRVPRTDRQISIWAFEPACLQRCQYQVSAYRASDGAESPHSNTVVVDGGPCPRGRTATVTFDTFRADDAPGRGPILGEFWANEEVLSFDGADPSWCGFYDTECGYYLPPADEAGYTDEIHVDELFAYIHRLEDRCSDCYEAASANYLSVSLPEGEDLTIGFDLWELHSEGEDTLLCSESCTIDYDDLRDDNYYYCPSHDFVAPCRVHPIMRVRHWPGGG